MILVERMDIEAGYRLIPLYGGASVASEITICPAVATADSSLAARFTVEPSTV